jgi:hypothetical protein
MLEACFQFKSTIFRTQLLAIHYTMQPIQSCPVFTLPNRRKIYIDGFEKHDMPLSQTGNKHAFDNEVRFACQTYQVLAGLSRKALTTSKRIFCHLSCH